MFEILGHLPYMFKFLIVKLNCDPNMQNCMEKVWNHVFESLGHLPYMFENKLNFS